MSRTGCIGLSYSGGAILIHTFGALFGLAAAKTLYRDAHKDNVNNCTAYHSDMFSIIGTLFLWICWPSFNAVGAAYEDGGKFATTSCAFAVAYFRSTSRYYQHVHLSLRQHCNSFMYERGGG